MARSGRRAESAAGGPREFAPTRWSVVLAAGHQSSPDSRQALELLCVTYWYPLYAYVRRRVSDVHEARDLTQEFFAVLLERETLKAADRERGRFRSFLLTSFRNFLADEWDKANAQKRGGGRRDIPLDLESAESRYLLEPLDKLTPERFYERQWALTMVAKVLDRLRAEQVGKGKERQFDALKPFLTGDDGPGSYAAAAQSLDMSDAAVKVAVHRLRRRFREVLRAEIAETVADGGEVDDELRSLREALC